MIDTHCHLTDPRLAAQLAPVLQRAQAAGVHQMISVGTTPDDWNNVLAICQSHPNIRGAIGVHPNESADVPASWHDQLAQLLTNPLIAAAGEMGLDYHYEHSPRDLQRRFFQQQLTLAASAGLSAIIHSRESVLDCLDVLNGFPNPAVFHCFTGTHDEADKILSAGHWLSFTGVITFKKSDALREIVKMTPADRIMVETDAPYLSPEPMRKVKVCEPAFVMHTAAVAASERGITLQELDTLTTANAYRFFRWT